MDNHNALNQAVEALAKTINDIRLKNYPSLTASHGVHNTKRAGIRTQPDQWDTTHARDLITHLHKNGYTLKKLPVSEGNK